MASLISEVSTHVSINHTIKSAEQVFYGQKSVYSTPNLNQASTSSADVSGKPESAEVAALRKQVSQLTLEKEQLTKEVSDLRAQLQKPPRLKSLADLGLNILILGDGNLSFTLALARRFPAKRIVGSVLESREEFLSRFGSGTDTLKAIGLECRNAVVRFGVDATQLSRESLGSSTFSDVIMNFPHHCGKTNLRRSRRLLRGVFESAAAELMTIDSTRLHITLARGQSGLCEEEVCDGVIRLPVDDSGRLPHHRPDSWQAVYLAAECGLRLAEARPFDPIDFPGYVCAGYLNREQRFHNENTAITLSFVKAVEPSTLINLGEARRIELLDARPTRRPDVRSFHAFRPYFTRDLSILYNASLVDRPTAVEEAEQNMLAQIERLAGPLVVRLAEADELRTIFDGRPNRIYRLHWQGDRLPLHKALVNRLQDELCQTIESSSVYREARCLCDAIPSASVSQPAAAAPAVTAEEDFDLFGSDDEEESEEQQRIREERLSAYAAKKARKPGPIAKSSVIIDVKPWDDETDLKKMEECVRSIIKDGLNWGASKTIPVGYGINKLQIVSTIEDEKISVDNDIVEFIQEEFADYVQSVDIVAFNKI